MSDFINFVDDCNPHAPYLLAHEVAQEGWPLKGGAEIRRPCWSPGLRGASGEPDARRKTTHFNSQGEIEMRIQTKVGALAVATGTLFAGGVAFAAWTATGTGTGTAKA